MAISEQSIAAAVHTASCLQRTKWLFPFCLCTLAALVERVKEKYDAYVEGSGYWLSINSTHSFLQNRQTSADDVLLFILFYLEQVDRGRLTAAAEQSGKCIFMSPNIFSFTVQLIPLRLSYPTQYNSCLLFVSIIQQFRFFPTFFPLISPLPISLLLLATTVLHLSPLSSSAAFRFYARNVGTCSSAHQSTRLFFYLFLFVCLLMSAFCCRYPIGWIFQLNRFTKLF